MKTFKQFQEQVNKIVPLSPYKVMPPMRKKDGSVMLDHKQVSFSVIKLFYE